MDITFYFLLKKNDSEEFVWNKSEKDSVVASDIYVAIEKFKSKHMYDLSEVGHIEANYDLDGGYVVYLNSVTGEEIVFDII